MERIIKKILKCGLHSYTAEIRVIRFPHTNRSSRIRKEALTWTKGDGTKEDPGFSIDLMSRNEGNKLTSMFNSMK